MPERKDKFKILLVEDNAGDVFLVREALNEAGFPHVLHTVYDGSSALQFLRTAAGTDAWPDLIILDLNLPGKSGRQVMAEMQETPELKRLPVAVLSTSHGESGIPHDFPRLRSTFAAKTANFRRLVEIVKQFREFACQGS